MTPVGSLTRDRSPVALSLDESADWSDDASSDECDEQLQRYESEQERDEDGGE